jgi:membrane-anchored protein YejM (alkaline phosphatase superfamily)
MKSQRRLALVWGRKFFFSYGLLSLTIVGLLFFQHLNKPESNLAWIYLITTFIGQLGMMITLGYFALYVPLVWISSGYYWSRFWAASLLSAIVGFVTLDALVVSQYRWHFYELLSLKSNLSFTDLLDASGLSTPFIGALVVFWVFLFVIGEKLWRHLQRKFSQTVSNWYLYPIIGCFIFSTCLHIIADHQGLTQITAYDGVLSFQITPTAKKLFSKAGFESEQVKGNNINHPSFFYPKDQLKCETKLTKNLVVILVSDWSETQFLESESDILRHYASHGQRFDQNFLGTEKLEEGVFSFFYALPAFYMKSFVLAQTPAVFLESLKNSESSDPIILTSENGLEFLATQANFKKFNHNSDVVEAFKTKLSEFEEDNRFSIFTIIKNNNYADVEETIKEIMESLVAAKKVKETNIVVASVSSSEARAPLFTLFPNREDQIVSHFTQLVDIVPSIMKDQLKCKNSFADYSLGQNLWETQKKNIVFSGLKDNLSVLSFDTEKKILVELENQDYLKELKSLTFFYKRSR